MHSAHTHTHTQKNADNIIYIIAIAGRVCVCAIDTCRDTRAIFFIILLLAQKPTDINRQPTLHVELDTRRTLYY